MELHLVFTLWLFIVLAVYLTIKTEWFWMVAIVIASVYSPAEAWFSIIWISMIKWLPWLYKRY